MLQRRQVVGIFLISASTLMLEIVLTRVFSVTMWYHFAFLAISMALLGSAVAGIVLYFFPQAAQPRLADRWLGWASLALALSIPLTFVLYLRIPVRVTINRTAFPLEQALWLALVYLDLTIPFFLSGLALSLALSAWSQQAGRLYWADLTGASVGCLGSILALEALGGAGAVLAAAVIAGVAGLALMWGHRWKRIGAAVAALLLLGLAWSNAHFGWITVTSTKGRGAEAPRVYEKWNAHSRVTVYEVNRNPFFWAVSEIGWQRTLEEGYRRGFLYHMLLLIDAVAGTPIQEFHGDLEQAAFLRYDVVSFAYHLVDRPETLVIGPGGGRDVLAALVSGAPHVTAVEVNPAIVEAMRGPFAEFSGHLYDRPDVTVVVEDARGYIARSPQRYDIIQAALIDTWAAGGSGAFALSENSLYTVEAFQEYYEHLTERGILTVSRWYLPGRPAETLRLLSTGMTGWARAGVADPSQHVAVIAHFVTASPDEGLANVLFKRTPFTPEEVATIQRKAAELGYQVLYAPGLPVTEEVGWFITAADREAFIARYPLDITPATDDRPFFFNIVRFGDFFSPRLATTGVYQTSVEAAGILLVVLGITTGAGGLFVLLPLYLGAQQRGLARPLARTLLYFGSLGVGFMMVEIPLIQRLTVYLGRPVYSLAVVLFSLLLCSGLGSFWVGRRAETPQWLFPTLIGLVLLQAFLGPALLNGTVGWPFPVRLALAVALIAPLGFLMGIPFPMGVRRAGSVWPGVVPWLWGINGVMSVLGSALAVAVAIHWGLRATLLIAAGCYGIAGFFARGWNRER
ncbi:MAG: hypothetical protein D6793_00850 [Thermoflexia bacterium]|nr:MAG: hypothetical protein D6793_00850 [Thermoflexia bacterium]